MLNKILKILKEGESEKNEFKVGVTSEIGKEITALLNTNGGRIIIGVDNKGYIKGVNRNEEERIANLINSIYPRPKNIKIERITIDKKFVFLLEIPKSDKLHTFRNISYVRIGSTTRELELSELIEKAGELLLISFDSIICYNACLKDIDKNRILSYLSERKKVRGIKIPKIPFKTLLEILKITKKNEITSFGILCFGKTPQNFYPYANIRIIEFRDEEMREIINEEIVGGSLEEQANKAIELLEKRISREEIIKGVKRFVSPSYPLEVLREGILNAIVHRNYFEKSDIRIFVFPNRIEIINPGAFPPDVSIEYPTHRPRNPLLCQYFYDMGYIEKYGSGILKMKQICRENNYPLPEYILTGRQTKLILHFLPLSIRDKLRELDEKNRMIVEYIMKNKKAKSGELTKLTSLSRDSLVSRLNKLITLKILIKFGRGKSTTYSLA